MRALVYMASRGKRGVDLVRDWLILYSRVLSFIRVELAGFTEQLTALTRAQSAIWQSWAFNLPISFPEPTCLLVSTKTRSSGIIKNSFPESTRLCVFTVAFTFCFFTVVLLLLLRYCCSHYADMVLFWFVLWFDWNILIRRYLLWQETIVPLFLRMRPRYLLCSFVFLLRLSVSR